MLPLHVETVQAKAGDIVVVTAWPDAKHDHVLRVCGEIRATLPPGVLLVSLPHGATLQSLTDDSLAQLGLRRADAPTHPTV